MKLNQLLTSLTLLALSGSLLTAAPLGTAFTYQGRLTDGGQPANGSYDLKLILYDAASGGSAVAGPLTNSPVGVTAGLFNVTLDFGVNVFTGSARWLQLAVRTNGSAGNFTPLSPRQPLTPAPHALFASAASSAAAVGVDAINNASVQNGAITATKIASGNVVKSINTLKDDVTLAAGLNLTLTPSGQTLTLASPTDWHMGGNAATIPGLDFLGTLDLQPLELRVNNQRRFLLDTNGNLTAGSSSTIQTAGGTRGSTIGGGYLNTVESGNTMGTIAGGQQNIIQNGAWTCTIGGGGVNTIKSNGYFATVPGGYFNTAGGSYSFAAGNRANATNSGTFVWADSQAGDFGSSGVNQFLIRAAGGVGINKNNPSSALDVQGIVSATGFNAGGPLRLNDNDLYLRAGSDSLHGLGWYGASKTFAGVNVDGPALYGSSGGALGTKGTGEKAALTWDAARSVNVVGRLNL